MNIGPLSSLQGKLGPLLASCIPWWHPAHVAEPERCGPFPCPFCEPGRPPSAPLSHPCSAFPTAEAFSVPSCSPSPGPPLPSRLPRAPQLVPLPAATFPPALLVGPSLQLRHGGAEGCLNCSALGPGPPPHTPTVVASVGENRRGGLPPTLLSFIFPPTSSSVVGERFKETSRGRGCTSKLPSPLCK